MRLIYVTNSVSRPLWARSLNQTLCIFSSCRVYYFCLTKPSSFTWKKVCIITGQQLVLGSDLGVQVFSPQYPTRKDMVKGQLCGTVNLKDNIDWFEACHVIKMLKDPVAKENLMLQQTHIQNLCVLDHFTSDASVFWYSFTWTRARLVIKVWFDIDTQPELVSLYPSQHYTKNCIPLKQLVEGLTCNIDLVYRVRLLSLAKHALLSKACTSNAMVKLWGGFSRKEYHFMQN